MSSRGVNFSKLNANTCRASSLGAGISSLFSADYIISTKFRACGGTNASINLSLVYSLGDFRGQGNELPGYYTFDLLVLRGATVVGCGDRDQAPPRELFGLPPRSPGCSQHIGLLLQRRPRGNNRRCVPRCVTFPRCKQLISQPLNLVPDAASVLGLSTIAMDRGASGAFYAVA